MLHSSWSEVKSISRFPVQARINYSFTDSCNGYISESWQSVSLLSIELYFAWVYEYFVTSLCSSTNYNSLIILQAKKDNLCNIGEWFIRSANVKLPLHPYILWLEGDITDICFKGKPTEY